MASWKDARLLLAAVLGLAGASASADGLAGSYLAGRSAALNGDLEAAAVFLGAASRSDPGDGPLLNTAITLHVAAGDVDEAAALASLVLDTGHASRPAALVGIARAARQGRWDEVLTLLDGGQSGGLLLDGLTRGWALLALGRPDESRAAFDALAQQPELETIARHYERLAFSAEGNAVSPTSGLASSFLTVGNVVQGQTDDTFTLVHLRLAHHLDPESDRALLKIGTLLRDMGRDSAAAQVLSGVEEASLVWPEATLIRALALRDSGEKEQALALLERLADSWGDMTVFAALGDLRHDREEFDKAAAAYGRALDRASGDDPRRWVMHFGRAVAHDRMGDWDSAEADLRTALAMAPDEPLLLNHLGYGLVQQGRALDEALGLLRRAVALSPEDGAIADSHGWALYMTGDPQAAVDELERAVQLSPADPVIIDHLGDVYWAVGRRTEARFQWTRALGYAPAPALAARLEDKLADGGATMAARQDDPNFVTVAHGHHPQTR